MFAKCKMYIATEFQEMPTNEQIIIKTNDRAMHGNDKITGSLNIFHKRHTISITMLFVFPGFRNPLLSFIKSHPRLILKIPMQRTDYYCLT